MPTITPPIRLTQQGTCTLKTTQYLTTLTYKRRLVYRSHKYQLINIIPNGIEQYLDFLGSIRVVCLIMYQLPNLEIDKDI